MSRSRTDLVWRVSSYSGGNGNCVQVAELDQRIAVRDSKNPDGGMLVLPDASWASFIAEAARRG